ncbi:hypothetical protein IQ06DRAFT_381858 [Phaeosphaeriaceae sp. SRC1lsM3a]|nr:hypothetical protein IQ06DRAFT_381858 [Stagonospora sp. SRC1lsM3a]
MDAQVNEHAFVRRRWTGELTRSESIARESRIIRDGNNVNDVEEERLKQLFQRPVEAVGPSQEFEVVDIAKEQLCQIIARFDADAKPSFWPMMGSSRKSTTNKVAEVLRDSTSTDFDKLKNSVENLEVDWKNRHGPVFAAFKKLCSTLDDHRSILKVFPSQNNYASPLVGSVTILMKAAKSHTEISLKLSTSIAEISEKVATCSNIIAIVKTARARRKLARIYARMFEFYGSALNWYLQSSFGRFMRSFNENLVKEFEEAKKDLEADINELYREVAIANTAIVAMVSGRVMRLEAELCQQRRNYETRDMLAGQRMERMMQETWTNVEQLQKMITSAVSSKHEEIVQNSIEGSSDNGFTQNSQHNLDAFIIDSERPSFSNRAHLWVSEKDVIHKLRTWMADNSRSRTLWISSPYEPGIAVPSCRAAVMTAIATAWQAEAPIISHSCSRPSTKHLRLGMNVEQIGLISLVYSFIRQLLQFNNIVDDIETNNDGYNTLSGDVTSWEPGLSCLRRLLNKTPVVTFCVIENLNELESNQGRVWCKELLDVLKERQQQTGVFFNILYSTAGQSLVLPAYVSSGDRHLTPGGFE